MNRFKKDTIIDFAQVARKGHSYRCKGGQP